MGELYIDVSKVTRCKFCGQDFLAWFQSKGDQNAKAAGKWRLAPVFKTKKRPIRYFVDTSAPHLCRNRDHVERFVPRKQKTNLNKRDETNGSREILPED